MSSNTERLSTGYIIVGAYADKVRRTLFAQAKRLGLQDSEVARASAELNMVLFEVLVGGLKADKGDVVRIIVNYKVSDGKISWDYSSLKVELFKRVPDDDVTRALQELLPRALESARRRQ